jgi:hypothetical protein
MAISIGRALLGAWLAFCVYFLYLGRNHIKYILDPSKVDMYSRARGKDAVTANCDGVSFEEIRTVRNVHDFDEVVKISGSYDRPIIFKGFLKNVEEQWDGIYQSQKDTKLEFSDIKVVAFGNSFYKGLQVLGLRNESLGEVFSKVKSDTSLFASFVPFMTTEVMKFALPGVSFDRFMFDTNFISNFNEDVVSTPWHAAAGATSYSMTYVGKKMWLFMDTYEYTDFNILHVPSPVPVGGTEKDYFNRGKPIKYVVTEPGDMLVFPPQWPHAVISKVSLASLASFHCHSI